MTVLQFLLWASHFLWVAFLHARVGHRGHDVYGGTFYEAWSLALQVGGWVLGPLPLR